MIDAVLDRLTRLHPKVIDLSLDRVRALLARLGNPQDHLPPVIHVAGTNGKGSTVANLRAICEAAGLTVHVYTSPHLVRFAERIRIAGNLPTDAELLALLEEVEQVNGAEPITFFEVTTAAAFLAFSRTPAHVVILETGLGGRLDATNVVNRPAATVITPVELDHQQFLGDALAAIAGEKAGILKPGVPCVSARQLPEAAAVLRRKAAELGASLLMEGEDFSVAASADGGMLYGGPKGQRLLPSPGLAGEFQRHNSALAVAAIEQALPQIGTAAMALGIASTRWPARLQRLTQGPLVDMLPPNWELWLDGGHNPHAAHAIAAHARTAWNDKPLLAVLGMLGTKDVAGYLAPLAPIFASLRAVAIPGEAQTLGAEDVALAAAQAACADAAPASSVEAALRGLTAAHTAHAARVLICGSLYLAGSVLAENS